MKLDITLEGEEKLKIINSTIGRQNQATNVSLIAKEEIEIENSRIQGDTISTKSNKITCDNKTNFISKKQILDSKNYNNLDITTNELIIDGKTFSILEVQDDWIWNKVANIILAVRFTK
jgi:hypothetical protein